MSRFRRFEVTGSIYKGKLMPLFYHPDLGTCKAMLKLCYDEGLRVFEFTNRGDFAHELFRDLKLYAERELPDMMIGTGSVVDSATASLFIQLGTDFIVTPLLNPDVIRTCNRRKILCIPGCATLSEISSAEELGCEIVKIFPGNSVGGPDFVKAVKGPCPWTSIMPSGGVDATEESIRNWLEAGAVCVGMGSKLFPREKDGSYNSDKVLERINVVKRILKTT